MTAEFLKGIAPLVERYDVFVIDLWGTLHDGVRPYPGAIKALERLAAAGKRVGLLSNAPRRAALAEATLAQMGFAPHLYGGLMTSGEAVHAALRDRPDPWHARLYSPCWHLGPARDRSVFEGLDIEVIAKPETAGFCVATGVDLNEETLGDYRPVLDRGLELRVPMICANPDIVVPVGPQMVLCAGAFAKYYSEHGGDVFWHGKPHKPIYARLFAVLEALGGPIDPARAIAIGDALPTDILGARHAGIASALVLSGIHREAARLNWRGRPDETALAELLAQAPASPDWVLPSLRW
jgi:HAD superfamily hydrolase (TIGR01459 family)